jgi:tetrahydromethanopterin S-methyltransferase subunit G
MKSYFATDGSYGDANEIVIIDTDKFTEEDWQSIEEELDYYRAELAKEIGKKYNG